MTWIEILRISIPGIILGIILGKIVVEKPRYLMLIDPRILIDKLKNKTLKAWLRFLSLSFLFAWILFFVSTKTTEFTVSRWGPILATENVFTGMADFSLLILLAAITLLPIAEEWIFRGVLLEEIKEIGGSWLFALVISSLAFAASHLFNPGTNMIALVPYFAGGVVLGTSYLLGGLAVAIASHITYNLLLLLL